MAHPKSETIGHLKNSLNNLSTLYQQNFIKRIGKITDGNREYFSEIIAEHLLELHAKNQDLFKSISVINRENYKVSSHESISYSETNRQEEITAKKITWMDLGDLGKVLDFQVPLKVPGATSKGVGTIDLISFNKEQKCMYLIEFKWNNPSESLLRAILEIYTYSKQVNEHNLLKSFSIEIGGEVDLDTVKVKPVVLIDDKCTAYKEADEITSGARPKLQKLLELLEVGVYQLKMTSKNIL